MLSRYGDVHTTGPLGTDHAVHVDRCDALAPHCPYAAPPPPAWKELTSSKQRRYSFFTPGADTAGSNRQRYEHGPRPLSVSSTYVCNATSAATRRRECVRMMSALQGQAQAQRCVWRRWNAVTYAR